MSPIAASSAPVFENGLSALPTPAKPRSCLVCRQRKVRCDKQSPCSNCRRGKIACISPSTTDLPPRWARRLHPPQCSNPTVSPSVHRDMGLDHLMDRVNTLESLVQELKDQLARSPGSERSDQNDLSESHSPTRACRNVHARESSCRVDTNHVSTQLGRLVLQDANRSRYVSSGFWSRVEDELNELKIATSNRQPDDSDSALGQPPSVSEVERTASERHAFIFGLNWNPTSPDLRELHPLPSQITFLLETFAENVNYFLGIVHIPTVSQVVRDWRQNGMKSLSPSNEALLFSIYYATIASMEEEDVMANFGFTKSELNHKFRLGVEQALAKSDFLNAPDLVLVQAFTIFLYLSRRYDSPRYIWMMTGFVIRMAQYLGLHRDGAHFTQFTPFEVELRRRAWWGVCLLDIRTSEDQGTDLSITPGSFDTQIPLNINDSDINAGTKEIPLERRGLTDMSVPRLSAHLTNIMREMMTRGMEDGVAGMQKQSRSVDEIYRKLDEEYLQYAAGSSSIVSWVAVNLIRLVMAKMTLIVFLPVLFAAPGKELTEEIRSTLLCAAIEVAEYNDALNAAETGRHLRWLYQTCTHWHAIVYLLIEITRRPWSPCVERAWVALHSSWLIPAPSPIAATRRIWVPFQKLQDKAQRYRAAELLRLRSDPEAVTRLEAEAPSAPTPSSPGLLGPGSSVEAYHHRWRQLVTAPQPNESPVSHAAENSVVCATPTTRVDSTNSRTVVNSHTAALVDPMHEFVPSVSEAFSGSSMDDTSVSWMLTSDAIQGVEMNDVDASMELDGGMDWNEWIESAKGMQLSEGNDFSTWCTF
ncbi:Zn(II)2Cys6 transcription factor [Aspergillus saccharolyticus JOP 1030-1]|uniref:Zn(2)-C6 fungal-type domain-containing protein n=1 Tax=Aspergillus saccharolyticus JOP 1030-1 TaxID=1450539 RepID=A0A318ZAP1_9EURO|nr:hypothetical protein BP01DRAFT_304923 [Aspergillus saccharolyticus JOP 1030-1]PYH41783.1 hypothetical protein BP01DRAFT_304923 [Aspergillus saccharolyticus JOP 1030-1]